MENTVLLREKASNTEKINNSLVDSYLKVFLDSLNTSTAKAYRTAVNLFANFFFSKDMKFVTIQELENIKGIDVVQYLNWLYEPITNKGITEQRYKNSTVKKHINGAKSFLKFLSKDFEEINMRIFENLSMKKPELTAEGWDGLEWTEAIEIWEYAQNNFDEDSNKLSMLFKLASITSIRIEALLSLKWSEHWFKKVENGIEVNFINIIDKGQPHKKPISKSFYDELKEKLPEDKLFNKLYDKKVNKKLQECIDALGFDKRRNIKFHSFKKAGVMRALELTGNMYKAKEQGNHSSMSTAEKYYLKYKENLTSMTSFSMDEEISSTSFDSFSKEELLQAIALLNDGSKRELLNILINK